GARRGDPLGGGRIGGRVGVGPHHRSGFHDPCVAVHRPARFGTVGGGPDVRGGTAVHRRRRPRPGAGRSHDTRGHSRRRHVGGPGGTFHLGRGDAGSGAGRRA